MSRAIRFTTKKRVDSFLGGGFAFLGGGFAFLSGGFAYPSGGFALLVGVLALLVGDPAGADSKRPRPESENYVLHCSGCHRLDGSGVPGIAPDLREIGALLTLRGGRAYLGSVPGVAQAPIGDDELAALLNWVLSEIAQTPPIPAYTDREIGRLRARPLRDPLAARRDLVAPKP